MPAITPTSEKDVARILNKIRQLELKTRQLVDATFAGQYHSVFKGRGMNFDEVREYAPGDEIRTIDWNVTARTGRPHIKKFTEERELTVMLVVDVSASGVFGSVELSKRELAAEVACVLAFSAIRNNDKVGLLLFTDEVELFIPPRKGRQHVLRVIREILFFEPRSRGTDPAVALTYLNRILTRKSVFFVLSDFEAQDYEKPLGITAARHDVIAVTVMDPVELDLPDVGLVTLEDAETGEQFEVNTSSKSGREAYRLLMSKRQTDLQRLLLKLRIDTIALTTDQDYMPALRRFFENRERRLARS